MLKKWIVIAIVLALIVGATFYYKQRPSYAHDLAVCAMFKNEAPYLSEWIDYHHHVLGVTHFYLYNNDSTDDYQVVLQPYIDKGIVSLNSWNSCEKHAFKRKG